MKGQRDKKGERGEEIVQERGGDEGRRASDKSSDEKPSRRVVERESDTKNMTWAEKQIQACRKRNFGIQA